VTGLEQQMASLGQQVTSSDQQVTGLEQQMASLGQQVTSSDQQVTGLEQQMASLDQQVTSSDQQVTSLGKQMTQATTEANALKRQLNAFSVLEQTTGQLDEKIYGLEQDIMAINGFRSDTNATIEQFRAQITALQYQ
jgi:chromosome segregation ATPase